MDLSFPRCDRAAELVVWPGDLAALMIGVAARQGGSRTAAVQGMIQSGLIQSGLIQSGLIQSGFRAAGSDVRLFAPLDGAFNGAVAASLVRWNDALTRRKEE